MKGKTLMASAMGGVFALIALTPVIIHASDDDKCGASMMSFESMDKDSDKKVTEKEAMAHMETMFNTMDEDDSGFLTSSEFLLAGHPESR